MPLALEIHQRFVEVARSLSPALADAIAQTSPIHLTPNRSAPFPERLCRAIAGQQLSVKAALSIWTRVKTRAGSQPLVSYLLQASPEELRACGLSAAKAKSMKAVAQAAYEDQLDAQALDLLTHSDRTERLTAIWGVGQWTADMMGIFYFGDPDIWPDGDLAARKMLSDLTSPRRKTIRTAARFAPYRSYLALYMWHQVNAPPEI